METTMVDTAMVKVARLDRAQPLRTTEKASHKVMVSSRTMEDQETVKSHRSINNIPRLQRTLQTQAAIPKTKATRTNTAARVIRRVIVESWVG